MTVKVVTSYTNYLFIMNITVPVYAKYPGAFVYDRFA